jgi:hypothetical protein
MLIGWTFAIAAVPVALWFYILDLWSKTKLKNHNATVLQLLLPRTCKVGVHDSNNSNIYPIVCKSLNYHKDSCRCKRNCFKKIGGVFEGYTLSPCVQRNCTFEILWKHSINSLLNVAAFKAHAVTIFIRTLWSSQTHIGIGSPRRFQRSGHLHLGKATSCFVHWCPWTLSYLFQHRKDTTC